MNLQLPEKLLLSNLDKTSLSSAKQRVFPLLVIIAIGLVLRLVKINSSFWYDEGLTGFMSSLTLKDLLHYITREDVHSPLYFLIIHFWAKIFPTDWGLRLFSLLTGVVSIPIFNSLSGKLFNRQIGLLASSFLALSPFHLNYSIEARPYSLYVFLSICALWFIVRALESNKFWNGWWLCYSFIATFMLYTHHIGLLIFLGMIVFHFFLIWPMDRIRFFQWIGLSILPILLLLPWIPIVLSQIEISKDVLGWIPQINLRFFLRMMLIYIYPPSNDLPNLIVVLLCILPHLLLLCLSVLITEPVSRKKVIALIAFAAVPIITITIYSYFVQPIFITRYLAPVVITLLVLPAVPFVLLKKTRWRSVIGLLTTLALILSFVNCFRYFNVARAVNWRDAAFEIKKNMKDEDAVLILPQGAICVFNFYFQDDEGTKLMTIDKSVDLNSLGFEFLKGRRRLWIIRNQVLGRDRARKVINWFDQKYNIIKIDNKFKWLDIILVNLEPKSEVIIDE